MAKATKKETFEAPKVVVTTAQMESLGIRDVNQVLEVANQVQEYVRSQELSVEFKGEQYVMVEGWQFAGTLFGLVSKIVSYENQSDFIQEVKFTWHTWKNGNNIQKEHTARGIFKYFAEAHCVDKDGKVVAQGFAMCSNEEVKKHTFDEYAILSMAQTRAVGKAYRLALSFIMKAAGFSTTPAEEIMDTKEAEDQAEIIELEEDIKKKIKGYKTADGLKKWANQQKDLHRNQLFLDSVSERIRELEGVN